MDKTEVKKKIVQACFNHGVFKAEEIQYVIATVEHETNGTFKPVREAYWVRDKFIKKYGLVEGAKLWLKWAKSHFVTPITKKAYFPYYGRGFVQLTWKKNYEKFEKILDLPLVDNPDLALEFDVALEILVYGMKEGIFTGKKLSDYFNHNGSDFIGARKIINGKNRAEHIAKIAQQTKVRDV